MYLAKRLLKVAPIGLFALLAWTTHAGPPPGAPEWLRQHMQALTGGSGRWIADNSGYRSDDEPFDAYGLHWEWGVGEASVKGRLFALQNGKEIGNIWEFRLLWHPAEQRAVLYQFGSDGTFGAGTLESIGERRTRLDQQFVNPDGSQMRIGHEELETAAELQSQSFDVSADGTWVKRRSYVWKRAPDEA